MQRNKPSKVNKIKLSFSNIAWPQESDPDMYAFLANCGYSGIEIAPTRIFPSNPYDQLDEAHHFAVMLKSEYGLSIPSMQSIWYGRTENIFSSDGYESLLAYTKQAIDFAVVISCPSLVFGNPKNRNIPDSIPLDEANETVRQFLSDIGSYARLHNVSIALEPNPSIYGTNFVNHTSEAIEFIDDIEGLALNVDFGTIIENDESLQVVKDNLNCVSHIHVSEPNLVEIKDRQSHKELSEILSTNDYSKYVSVEMKFPGDLNKVKKTAQYIKEVFT